MYKFIASIVLALSVLFGITAPTCDAAYPMQTIDGIAYYNGDTNLPTYAYGSGGCSVAELNSAVLVNESKKTAVVDFYGFLVVFSRGWNDPVDPAEESNFATRRLIYHKDTGKAEVIMGGKYTYKMISNEVRVGRMLYDAAMAAKDAKAE
ncbi:hypothetical protein [uncultured Selenomonas sp.]|uniref:hypothetical protein n=1 Tax=uncultured Selenomonas sp. TaxID=159275 RepID=UPI0025E6DFCF|nr:hypothetical protein [uncultured Selenomonas sp.]